MSGLPMPQPSTHVRGLRQIARIAFRRPAIDPFHDRVDLRRAQAHGVRELAVVRIGEPWRHHPVGDGVLDLRRTPARVLHRSAAKTGRLHRDDGRPGSSSGRSARRPSTRSGHRPRTRARAHRHVCAEPAATAAAAITAEIITTHSARRLLIGPTSGPHDSACRATRYCTGAAAFVTGTSAPERRYGCR